jgi:Fe-S-cluster containining protein
MLHEPNYMGSLQATGEDVKRWRREDRDDILKWAAIVGDEEDPWAAPWISSQTEEEAGRCPFVRKDRNLPTYRCTIYETRPQVCHDYVPWSPRTKCEEVADLTPPTAAP